MGKNVLMNASTGDNYHAAPVKPNQTDGGGAVENGESWNWYVAFTNCNAEKKVKERMKMLEIETYIPLLEKRDKENPRRTKTEYLFHQYVFFRSPRSFAVCADRIGGVAYVVCRSTRTNDFGIIRPEDVERLKTICRSYPNDVTVESSDSHKPLIGSAVVITDGPLKGLQGIVTDMNAKQTKFYVRFDLLGVVSIRLDVSLLCLAENWRQYTHTPDRLPDKPVYGIREKKKNIG